MKFTKIFYGVKDGQFHPTEFQIGDECPVELESAAVACEAVEGESAQSQEDGQDADDESPDAIDNGESTEEPVDAPATGKKGKK